MSCYYVGKDQPRMIRGRHDDECVEATWFPPLVWIDCDGCQECTDRHCLLGWHGERGDCETHAETVCPSCVGTVRGHLTAIIELAGLPLVSEALAKGVNSEAADLLGPAADPAQWRQRSDYGHRYDTDSTAGWHTHPYGVLGWFDMIVTAHLGHKRSRKITLTSAADYLGRNLHYLAADIEFDFGDLAVALEDCRSHLENVLHDGEQVERGAPCMKCHQTLVLVRDVGEDRWTCTRCRQDSSEAQYRFAVKAEYIERADNLNADDMAIRTKVPASTIRRWSHVLRTQAKGEEPVEHPPIIKATGRINDRKVYAVADVEFVRDNGAERLRDTEDAPAARSSRSVVA